MTTHTTDTHPQRGGFTKTGAVEIARRARSRAELFMLQDHRNSLKQPGPGWLGAPAWEELGYDRGFRDAMIEVMSWVTGRETDEILAEMHDEITSSN